MTDFIRTKGTAAFGTRLRRLSETLDREVQALYRVHDADFEPRWFPVVTALLEHGAHSVGELAAMIGITHAAVSQVRGELIAEGLIRVASDPADKRRQMLELSAKGHRHAQRLLPLWHAIAQATDAMCAGEAPRLMAQLDSIEAALAKKSLTIRVDDALKTTQKKIQPKERHHA